MRFFRWPREGLFTVNVGWRRVRVLDFLRFYFYFEVFIYVMLNVVNTVLVHKAHVTTKIQEASGQRVFGQPNSS